MLAVMRIRAVVITMLLLAACGGETKVEVAPVPDDAATTTTEQREGPQAYVDSGNFETGLHLGLIRKFDRTARTVTVDFATFAAYFDDEPAFATHFWFSLDDGEVSAIEEQYIP